MKPFFSRNIDKPGRLIRGLAELVMLVGAGFGFAVSAWLGLGGIFVGFEALRGWCVMRACGIKTRL